MSNRATEGGLAAWTSAFLGQAKIIPKVGDLDGRIQQILQLWNLDIDPRWLRRDGEDDHRWNEAPAPHRYRRGQSRSGANAAPATRTQHEHLIERNILGDRLAEVTCLDGLLIDGVNAIPLAKDTKGVEGDLLLLSKRRVGGYRLLLAEVKDGANTPWYAVIENLMQMKLLLAHGDPLGLFRRRLAPLLEKVDSVDASGLVLAPATYYTDDKRESVGPARALIAALHREHGVDIQLARWDEEALSITAY